MEASPVNHRTTNRLQFNTQKDGPTYYEIMNSAIGPLLLMSDGASITGLHQTTKSHIEIDIDAEWQHESGPFGAVVEQLHRYFSGELFYFDVPLAPRGTAFQLEVWRALMDVPYGETASYGEIALAVGRPRASRAVGGANHVNPISVIIPCHRIIGSSGSLTGYGFGLERKQELLDLERDALSTS